jgi:hypothetical protein
MHDHHRLDPRRTRRRATALGAAAACLAIGATLAACAEEEGSGDIATLAVANAVDEDVTALTVLDDFDVNVRVNPDLPQSATLRIDDNLVDDTDIWVDDDGELFIGWADLIADIDPSQRPVLTINVQDLEAVENRSDGTIQIAGIAEDDVDVDRSDDDGPVTFV